MDINWKIFMDVWNEFLDFMDTSFQWLKFIFTEGKWPQDKYPK